MDDPNRSYRPPAGFSPLGSIDSIRGLVDAIHRFLFEGPGTLRVIPFADRAGFDALVDILRDETHLLHEYLHELDNRTVLELPTDEADFEALDVSCRCGAAGRS